MNPLLHNLVPTGSAFDVRYGETFVSYVVFGPYLLIMCPHYACNRFERQKGSPVWAFDAEVELAYFHGHIATARHSYYRPKRSLPRRGRGNN